MGGNIPCLGHAGGKLRDFSPKSVCQGQAEAWWVHSSPRGVLLWNVYPCPSRGRIPLEVQPLSRNPSLAAAPFAPSDTQGHPRKCHPWEAAPVLDPDLLFHPVLLFPRCNPWSWPRIPGCCGLGGGSKPHPTALLPVWGLVWSCHREGTRKPI